MCEVASWLPHVVADTLPLGDSATPLVAWLTTIRATTDEYETLITVRSQTPDPSAEESDTSTLTSTSTDSAFDEILSQLGKEIYKLEEYQRNLAPSNINEQMSHSILNIFDTCLVEMKENEELNNEHTMEETNYLEENTVSNPKGHSDNQEISDCESTLSDGTFVTTSTQINSISDMNDLSDNLVNKPPVPLPRTKFRIPSTVSSVYDNIDDLNRKPRDSDSESTCWSYKECNNNENGDPESQYSAVWSHSSGFHNSDELLRQILRQNRVNDRLSFDTVSDIAYSRISVASPVEVGVTGDGKQTNINSVDAMTPDKPLTDDGYEPVRDAIVTDENIYEEIEYGYSYTDEGCSCGGSVEVESISMSASSEGVGRESPLYANLRDHDAYAVPADVLAWRNLLMDPFYNDDEEDEWITPEECAVYSREQRPPLVIPRISQHRPRIERPHFNIGLSYPEDTLPESPPGKYPGRQNDGYQDWSPTSERSYDMDRYSKASSDSPPFIRMHKKLGGSTENLLNLRRPTHLHLPPSSSGEGLDVDVRVKSPWESRNRKSKSVMVPKHSRSPAPTPAPRSLLPGNTHATPVIYEGQVKRTKFMENTKKCKKHWTDCYMVLTNTKLICFKDYKNYLATKNPPVAGTPPSPNAPRAEIILPLKNAYVISCMQMHTRRFTKSLMLTVGYDTYLLQFESEELVKRWLHLIQSVIYQLGPPIDEISSQNHYLSSNTDLESLGRTPPVTRHNNRNKTKAGGSSNEDLSDTTESSIQKHHTRSKLRKFFAKRPSKEMLEKQGIYKDEPVFGRNLSEVCPPTSPRVPEFVVACVREIEKTEENLCTDGLYRASGNLSQVQKIRLQIDQNNISVIENSPDIHVLAGSLKLFFRELKEPLIPCNMFLRVLAASSLKPREVRIREFRDIIQSLPQCNRDTLKFLLEHLLKVTKRSDQNRMHIANLAIVFGPTLLWAPAEQAYNIAIDCIQQNNVVDILLTDFKEIFADDNVKGKKKA